MNTSLVSKRSIAILLSFTLVLITVWFYLPQTYIASDPWAYSRRAYSILENLDFGKGHVFDHRIGVTLPVAFIYKLFGISVFTTNLWPLSAAIVIFVTIWAALPDNKSRIIGLILAVTSAPLLKASSVLYPDIIATAFMGMSSLLLFKRHKCISSKYWLFFSMSALLFLFLAFLAKLSAYWVLPFWIIFIIKDLKGKNHAIFKHFYIPVLLFGLLLGIGYLYFNYITWGSSLARIESIQSLTGIHLWASNNISTLDFIERLTISPVILLLEQYNIVLIVAYASIWVIPKPMMGWIYYVLFCVGFFWFGSTSFTQYEPMPLSGRMILPALPGMYILSAYVISKLDVSSFRLMCSNIIFPMIFVSAITVLPLARYVHYSFQSKNLSESHSMKYLIDYIQDKKHLKFLLLCSDQRSPNYLKIYFSYNYPENLKVLAFNQIDDNVLKNHKVLIYVDESRSRYLYSAYGQKNYDNKIKTLHLNELFIENSIMLYEVSTKDEKFNLLEMKKQADKANENSSL